MAKRWGQPGYLECVAKVRCRGRPMCRPRGGHVGPPLRAHYGRALALLADGNEAPPQTDECRCVRRTFVTRSAAACAAAAKPWLHGRIRQVRTHSGRASTASWFQSECAEAFGGWIVPLCPSCPLC